jgi:hypothetical protein
MSNYDLDYLINIAYEYYYIKKTEKCFETSDIELSDSLKLENVKIIPSQNKMNTFINQIFNTNINYLTKYEDEYIFTRIGQLNTTISISIYSDEESIKDMEYEKNKHKQYTFLLSDLVTKKLTKHILLPIMNIDIPIKNLLPFLEKYPDTKMLQQHINGILSVNISERFFKMMTLNDYLSKNINSLTEEEFMSIIFQVIHTLAIIRQKYKNFTHNLFTAENIFGYILDKDDHKHEYKYNNKTYICVFIGCTYHSA